MAGNLERFFRWVRPRPDSEQPDPADVGTAFGMELSLLDGSMVGNDDDETQRTARAEGAERAPRR